MLTRCAFDAWLFTNTCHPLVRADRRVTRFSRRTTLKAAWIDILPPSEQRAKERNLVLRRRFVMDGGCMRCHCPFSIRNKWNGSRFVGTASSKMDQDSELRPTPVIRAAEAVGRRKRDAVIRRSFALKVQRRQRQRSWKGCVPSHMKQKRAVDHRG